MGRNMSICRSALLAVVAVLALSGIAAASASAYTNPILENAKGEHVSKVKFTGKDGEGGLPIIDRFTGQYECSSAEKGTGELSTTGTGSAATTSGTATLLFKGCREVKTGKTGGEFEMKVALSLVWLGKESEERVGWLVAIPPESKQPGNGEGGKLKYTDHGAENELEGGFVASNPVSLGETFTVDSLVSKNLEIQQEFTQYTEEGKEQESMLWNRWKSLDKEPFEKAATEIEEDQTYGETVKIAKS
jgi:hypothetical protein